VDLARFTRERFERAIRLDPQYSDPHAALAEYYYYQALYSNVRPLDVLPAALKSAERAVQLDQENVEAHIARARYERSTFMTGEGQRTTSIVRSKSMRNIRWRGLVVAAGTPNVTSSHDEAIALFRIGNQADDRTREESATVFGDELIRSVQ
jgi:tetratricopeptide (TPR) repeat protein